MFPEATPPSTMLDLDQQLVVITGASRGLGAALARAFGREGARVVVNYYQSRDRAEALSAEIGARALAVQADVRSAEAVTAMVRTAADHFDRPVTTAVHNALVDYRFDAEARETVDTIHWDDYHAQLEGSVQGALHLLKACLPGMRTMETGRFIGIGSNLVQDPAVPYHDYTTGKAALLGFVRNVAQELGGEGITANLVSGGLLDRTDASAATSDAVFDIIKQNTPRGTVTTPQEVADAVLFFASPWARAVTGQTLIVDGWLVMQ